METATFILTTAGRNALVNALHTGVRDVVLTEVGYGRSAYTPTPDMTALVDEIKRIPARAVTDAGDGTISINALDDSSDAYSVFETGIYAQIISTGETVLFAVYSKPDSTPLLTKTSLSMTNIDFDLYIGSAESGTIQFGDTNFSNPPATTQIAGVIMLATAEEIALGQDGTKAITPAALIKAFSLDEADGLLTNVLAETVRKLGTSVAFLDSQPDDGDALNVGCFYAAPSAGKQGETDSTDLTVMDEMPQSADELETENLYAVPSTSDGTASSNGTALEVLDEAPTSVDELQPDSLYAAPASASESFEDASDISSFKFTDDEIQADDLVEGEALMVPTK